MRAAAGLWEWSAGHLDPEPADRITCFILNILRYSVDFPRRHYAAGESPPPAASGRASSAAGWGSGFSEKQRGQVHIFAAVGHSQRVKLAL